MRKLVLTVMLALQPLAIAADDTRVYVEMPPMMQQHMLANMRDHLAAINEIIAFASRGQWDKAGEVSEQRLGLSSLDDHGAHHMGRVMPKGMAQTGMSMHRAATAFALKAEEGDSEAAWKALADVTSACVACHAGYRIH